MIESGRKSAPMYDVGPCPVCGEGLRGVRICCGQLVIVCDECDAVWSSPALSDRISTTADPPCGTCGRSLWGDQTRWATREEIEAAGWWPQVRQASADGPTTAGADGNGDSAGTASTKPPADQGEHGVAYRGAVFLLLLVGAAVAALAVL